MAGKWLLFPVAPGLSHPGGPCLGLFLSKCDTHWVLPEITVEMGVDMKSLGRADEALTMLRGLV